MQGVLVDITARKNADEELRKAEERYRTLVESSPAGILTVDSSGHVIDCNNGACRLLGYPGERLRGADLRDMVASQTTSAVPAASRSALTDDCASMVWLATMSRKSAPRRRSPG